MNPDLSPTTPHDDGLEWLRDIRRGMFRRAGGDLKNLGNHYRQIQSERPEKMFAPREAIASAVRAKSGI